MAAFLRARRYGLPDRPLAGISATASLATDRPKRGPHRVHLAAQTEATTVALSLELQKGRRTRGEEERVVTYLVLNLVAETCGLEQGLPVDLLPGEQIEKSSTTAPQSWRDLLLGRVDVVREKGDRPCSFERPEGGAAPTGPSPLWPELAGAPGSDSRVIFPGAFNPLHAGHRRIMEVAQELLGLPAEPEISILNVDKPPLDYFEIGRRTAQFEPWRTVWLTRLPTFEEKSRQFPRATFLVGVDTLRRIADPKYYGNDPAACIAALERIVARGCRFLVFGRLIGERFITLEHLHVPDVLRSVCRAVPETQFREDVSSTQMRHESRLHDD